jgi:flagellar protein FlgJ
MSTFQVGSSLVSLPKTESITRKLNNVSPEKEKELKALEKACSDFESIFMHQMLKEMKKTVNKSGFVHGGQAEEIFSDMLDQERSKTMTIGLGDILFNQLSKSIIPPKRPK